MKIVMVPSGFKECLDAEEVALAMERGAKRFDRAADVEIVPMIDGGEGFAKTIIRLKAGKFIYREVTGPVGEKILSHFGIFVEDGKKTAVIEMAAVAGLKLVPRHQRNPLKTTTYGVGELILSALDLGVDQILIGCGDSGTSDGGVGMAQALGVQFLDPHSNPIQVRSVLDLMEVEYIDTTFLDERLSTVAIDVACNWKNLLCGDQGVARVFGTQKGATPQQVEQLSDALDHYASLIKKQLRWKSGICQEAVHLVDWEQVSWLLQEPHCIHDLKSSRDYINIEEKIRTADIVFTAEGSLDFQTPNGKIPSEVARIAKKNHIPVIAITGTIGKGAELNYGAGIDAYLSIIPKPTTLEKAIINAPKWIEDSTEAAMRQVSIGLAIAERMSSLKGALQK